MKKKRPAILIYVQSGILGITLALNMIFLVSCSSMPVRKSILAEDAPISYVFAENSGPTVVFEAGGGRTLKDWKSVFNDVAKYTTAVAYTRSKRINATDSRTGYDAAHTLRNLLEKIKAPKPYVLVGHSLGGMYVRCFAKLFPEDVAGLILVDTIPKGFIREAQRLDLDIIPANLEWMPAQIQAENRGLNETDEQLPTPAELGDMPVTVIVATKRDKKYESLQAPWLRFQKEFAEALPNGRLVIADGSGHDIQFDAPELLLREIQLMVNKVPPEINPETK